MTGPLLRLVWRLYPRRWRERFGAEAEADLARMGPGLRVLLDALGTLPRAWLDEVARRWERPREGRRGGGLGTDLRGAWRSVRRSPGRAALVVAILGLALGTNAAVFSVSWAVLLRTLPYQASERIVRVQPAAVDIRDEGDWVPEEDFLALPEVEAAGLYISEGGANLVDERGATRLAVTQVDEGFFPTLGVDAMVGRLIGPQRPASPEAVLSHALWLDAYGADPAIVGRTVDLSGHRFTVVGVALPDVDFPAGTDVWASTPAVMDFYGSAWGALMIARLRSREAIPTLAEVRRAKVAEDWADVPEHFSRPEVVIAPLRDELVGPVRMPLLALAGAAGAVLLLGCLNLAGIEVARVYRRTAELGVRRALGAGKARVFRHLAAEVALLAAGAGAASLLVAWAAGRILVSWLPPGVPGLDGSGVTPAVLLFTGLATAGAALAVGLLPAVRGARASGFTAGRTAMPERERVRLHQCLVVAQVAVAVVLAVGAGLLGRSLGELRAVPLGYDTDAVLTFRVRLPSHAYPDPATQQRYAERVEARLAALPGVEAVGHATRLPLGSGMGLGLGLRAGRPGEEGETVSATLIEASDGFFDAMGIRLLAGAPPTPPLAPGEYVGGVVIDRTTAERLYGGLAAVGRPIAFTGRRRDHPGVVAGVAEDVRLQGHEGPLQSVVYTSTESGWLQAVSFALRVRGNPEGLVPALRSSLAEVDPTVPPFEVRTTGQAVARELAAREALAALSGLFGVAGLLLVGLGLYGMVAQGVAARRRELGIRLALGAAVGRVVGSTVGRSLLLVLAGVAAGLPVAMAATRILRSLLFGVEPGDPAVVLGVVAVVLAVGILAALIPAARVGRIDPAESLRAE